MTKIIVFPLSLLISVILALSIFFPAGVMAQNIPEPGADASRFQAQQERRRDALEKRTPKAAPVEMPKEKEEAAPEGPAFVLKDIRVVGSTMFKQKEIEPLYQSCLGKEVTFADIKKVTEAIKAKYREKGYFTTIVYMPEQDIKDGVVEIKIVEGKMGKLKVEGNKYFSSSVLEKYIHLKKNELLNVRTLQKDILRLNQNTDLDVQTVISAGQDPETSDITLKVVDKFPYHVGSGFDNQGSRLVGSYRTSINFRATNFTGNNDQFYATDLMGASQTGVFGSYLAPIDTYGLKLGLDFTYFTTKLGREYWMYDITGLTLDFIPHISGELYLSDDFQANIDAGIDMKSVKKVMMGATTTDDQLRTPYFKFDFTKMDSLGGGGQTLFLPKFSFGTQDFLGSYPRDHGNKASNNGTGGFFFKYEHSLRRVQRMANESYMLIRSQYQFTTNPLPSSEQFQIGGFNSVRGYPEGDFLCDWGATMNFDWIFPCYIIPRDWKLAGSDSPLYKKIEPVIFFDMGGGRLIKPFSGQKDNKILMGFGGGLRVNLYDKFSFRFEWAKDIGNKPTQGNGPSSFYMSLNCDI